MYLGAHTVGLDLTSPTRLVLIHEALSVPIPTGGLRTSMEWGPEGGVRRAVVDGWSRQGPWCV